MAARGIYASMNTVTSMINGRSYFSLLRSTTKLTYGLRTQRVPSLSRPTLLRPATSNLISSIRSYSSLFDDFKPKVPESLTAEIAGGILDLTQFYCRHGVAAQQLRHLASVQGLTTIELWQQMMEVFVTTQINVVAGLGYSPNPSGLDVYALHLAQVISKIDDSTKQLFDEIRADTFRCVVGIVFKLDANDIPKFSIEEARELMRKVSDRMIDPETILTIQNRTCGIRDDDKELELQMRHAELQTILVDTVYIGGSPSLVEEMGFGSGAIGYAKIQCVLCDHDSDPIMANYASTSMIKILSAAGIEIDNIEGSGLSTNPV